MSAADAVSSTIGLSADLLLQTKALDSCMLCSFDENGDGHIGINEFCTAMATIAAYAGNEEVDAAVEMATESATAEKAVAGSRV